ncbi:hypothetical protein [Streptomyces sp. TS71-3]|uniref:hypothetical protein n=1 Tax=Streptomyces sp. TS71-3 TaxID=2733862 RepID=UPI001B0BA434|nr:hypothetical protein [Streptomyces sp. TS71-3]GHJ39068.1 hypothetical protein Sm713_46770 [Streptomyces sp. TS71-3]
MWPGDQPPGGEQNQQNQGQNPYQQPGYQQPNPYQQPGYQQPNPYTQPPGQQPGQPHWSAPTVPGGPSKPPRDDRKKTMITAVVAAAAVVIAAGVTGFLVLGGKKDDKASPAPSASSSASPSGRAQPSPSDSDSSGDDQRGTQAREKTTIPGWKTVINTRFGTVFDVPPEWEVEAPTLSVGFEWDEKGGKTDSTTVTAPAEFKSKWCTDDSDKDGTPEDTGLATAGARGENGAKNTDDAAETRVPWWIYGGYTHPDKKTISYSKAKPYTTKSGLKGSLTTAHSTNTPQRGKCATDGKAITFAFKNGAGDIVSWDLFGVKGVKDELPEATVQKILSTVRLTQDPPTGE